MLNMNFLKVYIYFGETLTYSENFNVIDKKPKKDFRLGKYEIIIINN